VIIPAGLVPSPPADSRDFRRDGLAILRRLKTPERVQSFLDSEIGYNKVSAALSPVIFI
jgi:hypothetical protein